MDLSYAAAMVDESGAVLTAACRQQPAAAVPTCPEWDVAALTTHLGAVQQWAAANLRGDGETMVPFGSRPDGADAADWADEQRATLMEAFASVDPDKPVWSFGPGVPARTWWRRQLHETTVHAWDGTNALGSPWTIPGDVAADGIDEMLTMFIPRRWKRTPPEWGNGKSVHLHRTDGEGEWLLTIGPAPTLTIGHAKGDLSVQAGGADLLLWVLARPATVTLFGDTDLAAAWTANVSF